MNWDAVGALAEPAGAVASVASIDAQLGAGVDLPALTDALPRRSG